MFNNINFNNYCFICNVEYERWCLLQLESFDPVSKTIPANIIEKYSSILQNADSIMNNVCEFCYQEFLNMNELLIVWERSQEFEYESNACRICCTEFEEWNLVSFNTLSKNLYQLNLFEKLGTIVGDDITKHFDRPKHICEFCFSSLKSFGNFIQTVQKWQLGINKTCEKGKNVLPTLPEQGENKLMNNTRAISLDNHFIVHDLKPNNLKKILCELCIPKKIFLTLDALKLHNTTLHQINRHDCQFCKREFSSKQQRNDHENTHTDERPYKCDVQNCSKAFHKKSEVIYHKKVHDGVFQTCNICGKKNLINLRGHLKLHTQNRYKCPACPRTFLSLTSLEIHSKMHRKPTDNERQYKCQYCLSIFKRGDRLKEHINALHLNIKRHICIKCEKKFATGYQLNTHIKQVHSESAFSCDKCGRTYSLSQSLIKHYKIAHENFKKFKCEICEEGFNTFSKFKKHQDSHNLNESERKKIIYNAYKQVHKNIYEN